MERTFREPFYGRRWPLVYPRHAPISRQRRDLYPDNLGVRGWRARSPFNAWDPFADELDSRASEIDDDDDYLDPYLPHRGRPFERRWPRFGRRARRYPVDDIDVFPPLPDYPDDPYPGYPPRPVDDFGIDYGGPGGIFDPEDPFPIRFPPFGRDPPRGPGGDPPYPYPIYHHHVHYHNHKHRHQHQHQHRHQHLYPELPPSMMPQYAPPVGYRPNPYIYPGGYANLLEGPLSYLYGRPSPQYLSPLGAYGPPPPPGQISRSRRLHY